MDPYYELFSTPPEQAPLNERDKNKQPQRTYKPRAARNQTKLSQTTQDLVFSPPKQTYTPKKIDLEGKISLRQRPHKKGEGAFTSTPTRSRTRAASMIAVAGSSKQQQTDIWEKCMKTNPELQNFVDKFNQSLEVALKNPLDIKRD